MNAQCNSCGGFFGIEKCPTCNTLICERCRTNHEIGCGQAQNMKSLGLGPTVRTAVPVLIPVEPVLIPVEPVEHVEVVSGESTATIEAPAAAIVDAVISIPPAEAPAIIEAVMTDLTGIFDNTAPSAVGVSPEVIPETAVNTAGVVIVTDTPTVETQAVNTTDEGSLSDVLGSDILGK